MDIITKKIFDDKSSDGMNLFQHLEKVIYKIVSDPNVYTKDLEAFELISDFVKKNTLKYKLPLKDA